MEDQPPESRFVTTPYPGDVFETHGVVAPGHGPLFVLIMRTAPADADVGVYDATTGTELTWINTMTWQHDQRTVAAHVYEAEGRAVLVIAADQDPVRQWELPSGRPIHTEFDPDARSRAVTSYRRDGQTVLVIADAYGVVRRFDARSGAVVGRPIPTRPAIPLATRMRQWLTREPVLPPGLFTLRRIMTMDRAAAEPAVMLADFDHGLLRVELESGEVIRVGPEPRRRVWELVPDPRTGRDGLILGGAGYLSADTTIDLDYRPYAVRAVPSGADLLIFASQSEKVRRYGGPGLAELAGLGVEAP